jgi:hypothetical protein
MPFGKMILKRWNRSLQCPQNEVVRQLDFRLHSDQRHWLRSEAGPKGPRKDAAN